MTNNDILRRIRYTFNFEDSKMMAIFGLAGLTVTRVQVSDWLKKEGAQPEQETKLNNNIIFRKLRIALDLKADEIMEIFVRMSGHQPRATSRIKKINNRSRNQVYV